MNMTHCYVFVDQGDKPILAGRYLIDDRGLGSFTYGESYADNAEAFAFDPINLPITAPLQIFHPKDGKSRFGVLSDAAPDTWGRKLIAALHQRVPGNEVEWLIASQGNGVGCLVFSGSRDFVKSPAKIPKFEDLQAFFQLADRIENGLSVPREFEKLIEFGSSMGGVRPKILVTHQGREWIAKINRKDDLMDMARVEYATLTMAKKAGIHTCNLQFHEVAGHSVVLVERFDRHVPQRKRHYISAHSLLDIPKITPIDLTRDYSYMGMAAVALQISENPESDCHEIYRRMVFNVLCGNTDDHFKNHGFLLTDRKQKQYQLAPAFDVVPQIGSGQRLQAIGIGQQGREATLENALSDIACFRLSQAEAQGIIETIQEVTQHWQKEYKACGVGQQDIRLLTDARIFV